MIITNNEVPGGERVGLSGVTGEKFILEGVSVDVDFNGLLCETVIVQKYQNPETKPIEAVYTFPLSSLATLLGLEVSIGEKKMRGIIVNKDGAEKEYESALSEGNTAIMLEKVSDDLYTLNVGNILPGEKISISVQYAELYSWNGDTIRYLLPTTIAPRYGDPEATGMEPHQVPTIDLLAQNHFDITVSIFGELAEASIESPSHKVNIQKDSEKATVTLENGQADMDRDFILNIRSDRKQKNIAVTGHDIDEGFVVLSSFAPEFPGHKTVESSGVTIIVDCSGSMSGDSIAQARDAINQCLQHLRPTDYFNIVRFGSTYKTFFDHQVSATRENVNSIRKKMNYLNADMGGTEISEPLDWAMFNNNDPDSIPQNILLITDGEVWDTESIIALAKRGDRRIFTVGVGSSVAENLVRKLAQETSGACELVFPNENMAEKIVRHFSRIFLPQAKDIKIHWPTHPVRSVPQNISSIFDGDTLHIFAFFQDKPEGYAVLETKLPSGEIYNFTTQIPDKVIMTKTGQEHPAIIARLGIGQYLHSKSNDTVPNLRFAKFGISQSPHMENDDEAKQLALKYQLMSYHTNYIVVHERDENEKNTIHQMPEIRAISQKLAAGWGGLGSVTNIECCESRDIKSDYMLLRAPTSRLEVVYQEGKFYLNNIYENKLTNVGVHTKDGDGKTPLFNAAIHNNIEIGNKLINNGANVNEIDNYSRTPLFDAVKNHSIEFVDLLIFHGADVNILDKYGNTLLIESIKSHSVELSILFINNGLNVNIKNNSGETALHYAVNPSLLNDINYFNFPNATFNTHIEMVDFLVREGAYLDIRDKNGITPLFSAVHFGLKEVVECLINSGADVNAQDDYNKTPLLMVRGKNSIEIAKLLIGNGSNVDHKYNDGTTLLCKSLMHDFSNKELVELLIDHGADMNVKDKNGRSLLFGAAKCNFLRLAKILIENGTDVNEKDYNGETPLFWASRTNSKELAELLIDHGANVNEKNDDGETPFLKAAEYGSKDLVELLVDHGADVNVRNKNSKNSLLGAVRRNCTEIVKMLIDNGANVNEKDDKGETPLFWASRSNFLEIAKLLIDHGANVNQKNDKGETPLFWASKSNFEELVKLLIIHGANVNEKNDDGETPLFWASRSNFLEIAKLLIDHGANVNENDDNGNSPLSRAAEYGPTELARLLFDRVRIPRSVNR